MADVKWFMFHGLRKHWFSISMSLVTASVPTGVMCTSIIVIRN
ncbi:MAG: hypothetical protein ABIJ42_05355 [Acidobacteriota bacterium]